MATAIVIVFILGYFAITIEHSLKIDKLVPALLMMAVAWALVAFGIDGLKIGLTQDPVTYSMEKMDSRISLICHCMLPITDTVLQVKAAG